MTSRDLRFMAALAAFVVVGFVPPAAAQSASTIPWLVLLAAFGSLAVIIAIVALWGAGRGPEPRLERTAGDHDHGHGGHAPGGGHADAEGSEETTPDGGHAAEADGTAEGS